MIVSTAHISSEKNLAEACALLLETGAMSLTLSGPKQRRLSLNEVRGLLINHQLPLTQRLQDLPDPITGTDEVWQEPTAGSLIELLSAFFDSTSDAIYIKDVQGRYLFANEAYATAVGYPLANIIGHTDLAICTPAVARQTMKLDAEIIAQNRKKTFEETIANRHGINTYLTTKMPLWSRGNLLGMLGTARELIAFSRSNAIQYRQEEQLEAIFQSLPDLFFRIAPDGTILDYRAQVEADLYKPASEFLGRRMQDVLPDLMDTSGESESTLELYGTDNDATSQFGRQCLLARRLVEAGVRFVEVTHGGWDHHRNLSTALPEKCEEIDKPIAGLLKDLKQRDMLKDTLVIWGGEFGRTPSAQSGDGRDHNNKGYTTWMAGGGVKGGFSYGATDELGYEAVENKCHIHDWHATILHLLGLDHEQLTFRYAGRDFRLTDVYGNVAKDIIA